jgi:hypothetical protein
MFENKIEGHERQVLLGRLNVLYSYGWRSILMSDNENMIVILVTDNNEEMTFFLILLIAYTNTLCTTYA